MLFTLIFPYIQIFLYFIFYISLYSNIFFPGHFTKNDLLLLDPAVFQKLKKKVLVNKSTYKKMFNKLICFSYFLGNCTLHFNLQILCVFSFHQLSQVSTLWGEAFPTTLSLCHLCDDRESFFQFPWKEQHPLDICWQDMTQ